MLDNTIFTAVNSLAGSRPLIDTFFILVSAAGIGVIAILLLATKDKRTIAYGLSALILASIIDVIINLFYFHPRPFAVQDVNLLVEPSSSSSMPSGHTLRAFALAQAVYFGHRKLGIAAYILALLVGFSRIWVGVHWPSDVIAGILVGTIAAFTVKFISEKIFKI